MATNQLTTTPYCTIDEAIEILRAGRPVILKDEPEREDEGDLIVSAQLISAETINLMLREARGLLTVPMEQARLEALNIALIPPRNTDEMCPRFTVPVDAVCIHSTGISASDRARTIRELIAPETTPDDFIIPGHVFPLAAHPDGLWGRRGHTEGSLELARMAGLYPAVAMCEILRTDGEMAKGPDLEQFAGRLGLRIVMMDTVLAASGLSAAAWAEMAFADLADKVLAGKRLTFAQLQELYAHHDLTELGALADLVRTRKHPEPVVTYVLGRNVNYTNVCWVQCKFCNFCRSRGSEEAYVLSEEALFAKVAEMVAAGGTELLMQGGLNPELDLEYFENLLRRLKARFPIHVHSLSATEVLYLSRLSRLPVSETLSRLHAAGLDSLPGAGAEILVDRVRQQLSPRKERTEEWLEVHRQAHRLGMDTTATMMYGSVETLADRVEHLLRIRELQDESLAEGGGRFLAFIPWSFQPVGTELQRRGSFRGDKSSGYGYLRTVAVSRLALDNVANLQASWVTQGAKVAQLSLKFGVNDFGSTMMEENVVSQAGARFSTSPQEIEHLIRAAGYAPRVRNTKYDLLEPVPGSP